MKNMKRVISLFLSIVMMFGIITTVDLSAYANNTSNSDNNFSKVSYTDVFYGYTWYLMNYNDIMRKSITDSIIKAGEQFGIDDKFFASLETALDTVGSFSKTFYTITDAMGITSKLTDDAADKAITSVLTNIYEDKNSEFWNNIVNKETESLNALKNSFDFIDNFNQAGFENYTLNELYNEVLQQSINKTCEFDVAVGHLNDTQKTNITNTVYEYYKDSIKNWENIVKITKCINTILFYQNLEVELIDYILEFDNLDEDLIKGLIRIKTYINSNYATYFVETITKEVIDNTLNKIGSLLGYGTPLTALASTACQFSSWLFFDVIYQHADAEDYLAYIYLLKFLYSVQYEMNNKLNFFNTDLVYSDTIDDFEYFYKIYSSAFKSSKKYAEKLLGKEINYIYQDYFFECKTFIDYIRNEVEKINVDERVEKATITDKTYKFDKPIILTNEEKDLTCLVTFHNRILAPLVIDNNVEYDDCDLIIPKLTISKHQGEISINKQIVVNGDFIYNSYESTLTIENGGIIEIEGDCIYQNQYSHEETYSSFIICSGGKLNIDNNLILNGGMSYGYRPNKCILTNYGEVFVGKDLICNTIIEINNYGYINVFRNADFIAGSYITAVTIGYINLYENSIFLVNENMALQGKSVGNTGNNWFILNVNGCLCVNNNFSASNRFVSFNQNSINSVWTVNGDFYADVLNDDRIWGFGIGYDKGYTCNLVAGKLILRGDYKKGNGLNISPRDSHTIILVGDQTQNISGLNASNIIIDNIKEVNFNSDINVTTLFNHKGNPFTLYNDGKGSTFPDYDGDGYKDNVDPYPLVKHPDEHDYIFRGTVAPTCVEKGYDAYICKYCNSVDKRNIVDIIPHNYIFSETVLPTCTTQGYDLYTCSNCNGTEKRNTVSAKGHSYAFTKTVAPTCTAQGYDLYTCSVCNGTEKRNVVSSTGHNYEVTSNTATCTAAGIKTSVCSKCGDKKEENASALGHTYSKIYTAPTCTETGGYTNTCKRCGDITYDVYAAKGHDYGEIAGQDYVNKIAGSTISANPNYFNEFYHTSSSIGSAATAAILSTNMAVPNEIRLDINNMGTIKDYQFAISGGIFSRRECECIFAYNESTGRSPEESAIPYTDSDGNLVDMHYIDYKTNNEWVSGRYLIENNKIVDLSGTIVCDNFTETRPHIVYTKSEALEKGIMNSDGTVNVSTELANQVSFSAGIPGVYFTATNIAPSLFSSKFVDVFGFDKTMQDQIKGGKYDVNLCFYEQSQSGFSKTTYKIYDGSLIKRIPATLTAEERIEYTCMDCGETRVETCALKLADFKIAAASISLANNIRMNYKVLKTAVADFENPYIEVTRNGKTVKITEYSEQGDYYVFSYKNIAPQCMGDTLTAVLYGTHNGILYSSNALDFSVKEYAYRMLQICEPEQYSSLRTLLVDMLNYGSEAQIYMNYSTDKLVNADLTEQQKSWASNDDLSLTNIANPNYKEIENASVIWKGAGLSLYDSISVRYTFTAENIHDLSFRVTCNDRIWNYDRDDIIDNGDGTYSILFTDLNADQMSDAIYITAYNSDIEVSNTLCYSVESYAALVHSSMPNSGLEDLTRAMIKYGTAAKKYAM